MRVLGVRRFQFIIETYARGELPHTGATMTQCTVMWEENIVFVVFKFRRNEILRHVQIDGVNDCRLTEEGNSDPVIEYETLVSCTKYLLRGPSLSCWQRTCGCGVLYQAAIVSLDLWQVENCLAWEQHIWDRQSLFGSSMWRMCRMRDLFGGCQTVDRVLGLWL